MTIGVLALQGDVREHLGVLAELSLPGRTVRGPADMEGLCGLILPGGESTTLSLLLGSSGLFEPIAGGIEAGLPVFGTCAGLVLLARQVRGGRPDQRSFGALDCTVLRNGFGRQKESFESEVDVVPALGETPVPAVFIRAPLIEAVSEDVEVLGWLRDGRRPVLCRQGSVLAAAFHPELTNDHRLHRFFAQMVAASEYDPGRSATRAAARG